ncbi:MAG: DUF4124 domain-containing protein [Gammaproteobacteria bacterium]|nr:DUF4124 domain-containing protein [Gammaproteobacteria bacterium]
MKPTRRQYIAGILLLGVGGYGHAEIYRCVDDSGHVIFTQHRCAPTQESERVNLGNVDVNRKPKPAVCRQVERLAELLFPHINETDSILDVYTQLGGREYLSAGVTAAVNYVFNYRYNPKAGKNEVVALTHAKCLDGGFGRITEKDLPDWDRIKYKQEKPAEAKPTKEEQAQLEKTCAQYDTKLTELHKQLETTKDKSKKLQVRVDLEYYEGLKRKQCKAADKK